MELMEGINEVMLLHGSGWVASEKICQDGFERAHSAQAALGLGNYFAENSDKADEYVKCEKSAADKESCTGTCDHPCRLILARVLMGSPHDQIQPQHLQMAPPPTDSVIAVPRSVNPQSCFQHREFVIYSNEFCYPEYLVTYRRVAVKDPAPAVQQATAQ
eukprot:c20645_g1_i6.p1 GENE.c20645_g1_i6~~c20645_g1_i6.p1  ORF type:complete len:160 (-),score=30.53 c20645_g1_i6:161-640(-)